MVSREVYKGRRRRIVLAFDVGTTWSGISYSILDPGQVPSINAVTRFPGQGSEDIANVSKIPTIVYYDRQGVVKAVGAKAASDGIYEMAEDGEWTKAQWFKLYLRSRIGADNNIPEELTPLPPNKTVIDVFSDFLAYLLNCAAAYIADTHPNGETLWRDLRNDIQFVLAHPNGWQGREQSLMRKAAVKARLIPDTYVGHRRLSFVTEGEASLHFAIENRILSHARAGEGIVVVDAGGGTIDISTYQANDAPNGRRRYEEIAVPQCHFYGSVFVTMAAKKYLKDFLKNSDFADDLDHIARRFDETAKHHFMNPEDPQFVKFGSVRDNDKDRFIRYGQLRMEGRKIAEFFQPSIDCIVNSVTDLTSIKRNRIKHVILVGGFSTNDHLFKVVKICLRARGLIILRPEKRVNKAVSDGAISFFLDHYVHSRISRIAYGAEVDVKYCEDRHDHVRRLNQSFISITGDRMLGNHLELLVPKVGTKISETREFRLPVSHVAWERDNLKNRRVKIVGYRGVFQCPEWMDIKTENYISICDLEADLSRVPQRALINADGRTYYSADCEVILLLGLTEIEAQLEWKTKDEEFRSPATIIYDN